MAFLILFVESIAILKENTSISNKVVSREFYSDFFIGRNR